MNNKSHDFLCSALLLLCSTLVSFSICSSSLHASTNTDRQTVSVIIPKVALIKLDQTEHTFVFSGNTESLHHTSRVAISSNDRNARMSIHVSGLPADMGLTITTESGLCAGIPSQSSRTFSCRIGLKAIRDGKITLAANRKKQHNIPDGRYTATITYTLGD